jgi:hypothetical protein
MHSTIFKSALFLILFSRSDVNAQNALQFNGGGPSGQNSSSFRFAGLPHDVSDAILPSDSVMRIVFDNLLGSQSITPGEVVRFAFGWDMEAPSVADSTKVMPISMVKSSFFTVLGGDAQTNIRLKAVASGDEVYLKKPMNAPVGPMVRLYEPPSVVGMPQTIVKNRLSLPNKIEETENGGQRWIYHYEIPQKKSEVEKIESQTTGTILDGDQIVPFMSTTVQKIDVEYYRLAVIWSFSITFGPNGRATAFERGDVGFTEWTRDPQ